MTIDDFKENDTQEVLKLHREIFDSGVLPLSRRELLGYSKRGKIIVARDGEKIVGYLIAQISSENAGRIFITAVKSEYRRKKIGSMLVRRITQWFKERNKGKVWIFIISNNEGGIKFWKSLGFEKEGQLRDHFKKNQDILILSKFI